MASSERASLFRHVPLVDVAKGKVRVGCRPCGWRSPDKFPDEKEAMVAYREHVGLKELQRVWTER